MLVIDGKEYEVRLEEVKVGNFRLNGVEGHDVCLFLEFYDENDVNGYINLNGGFELEEDIFEGEQKNRIYWKFPTHIVS